MGKDLKGKDIGKGFSQRKDGRYEARATINGVKIDIYGTNLAKLKKEFEQEKIKVLKNEKVLNPDITLNEWFTEWFKRFKSPQLKNDVCRKVYERKIKNTYIDLLGDKKISNISQINIQDASIELINRGYTANTIRTALGVLAECLDVAILNRFIINNPCKGIKLPEINEYKEKRVLSNWEQELFLEVIQNKYYEEAYKILLSTGMRVGEFSGLQWGDVDFENQVIHIRRSLTTAYDNGKKIEELSSPKTANSYRDIPFFGETETLFLLWKKKQDTYKEKLGSRWRANPELGDLVFTTTMGSPVTRYVLMHDLPNTVGNMKLMEEYNADKENREPREIKGIHPHAFRHTFITRLFEKGLEPIFIQRVAGHSNYQTTLIYTHILDEIKKRETEKVGNFFEN